MADKALAVHEALIAAILGMEAVVALCPLFRRSDAYRPGFGVGRDRSPWHLLRPSTRPGVRTATRNSS